MARTGKTRTEPAVPIAGRIPESLRQEVRIASARLNIDTETVLEQALRLWLAQVNKNEAEPSLDTVNE